MSLAKAKNPTRFARCFITAIILAGVAGRSYRVEHGTLNALCTHALVALFVALGAVATWVTWNAAFRRAALGVVFCELIAVSFGAADLHMIFQSRGDVNAQVARIYASHPALVAHLSPQGGVGAQIVAFAQRLNTAH